MGEFLVDAGAAACAAGDNSAVAGTTVAAPTVVTNARRVTFSMNPPNSDSKEILPKLPAGQLDFAFASRISSDLLHQGSHQLCCRQLPRERRALPGPLRAVARLVRGPCGGIEYFARIVGDWIGGNLPRR